MEKIIHVGLLKKVRDYGLQYKEEALDSVNHIIE